MGSGNEFLVASHPPEREGLEMGKCIGVVFAFDLICSDLCCILHTVVRVANYSPPSCIICVHSTVSSSKTQGSKDYS